MIGKQADENAKDILSNVTQREHLGGIARYVRNTYEVFVESGFTDFQALELAKIQFSNILERANKEADKLREQKLKKNTGGNG